MRNYQIKQWGRGKKTGEEKKGEEGVRGKGRVQRLYAKCEDPKIISCLHEEVWARSGSLNWSEPHFSIKLPQIYLIVNYVD